jgi:hypothetical protein
MIELLLPCGFDTLEYSWVRTTIGICTLVDYSVAEMPIVNDRWLNSVAAASPGRYRWLETLAIEWEVWDRGAGDPYK